MQDRLQRQDKQDVERCRRSQAEAACFCANISRPSSLTSKKQDMQDRLQRQDEQDVERYRRSQADTACFCAYIPRPSSLTIEKQDMQDRLRGRMDRMMRCIKSEKLKIDK